MACKKLLQYLTDIFALAITIEEFDEIIGAAIKESPEDTMQIIFDSRDCHNRKGGLGNRRQFIFAMTGLSENHPALFERHFERIPIYGRWLDLIEIYEGISSTYHKMLIINFLADTLIEDIENMNEGEAVSYLAKWLPSENKLHDRRSDISIALCKKLYYTDDVTSYIRKQYRKDYLTPLRTYEQVCEKKMCANKWDDIHYSSVPVLAMKRYKYAFKRHTPERYNEWATTHQKN